MAKEIHGTHNKSLGTPYVTVVSDRARYISISPMSLAELWGLLVSELMFSDPWFEIFLYRNMIKQEKEIM